MSSIKNTIEGWSSGSLPPPIAKLLGISLREWKEGESTLEMRVGSTYHNPLGTVHGGILCDLSDAAMGTAVASLLNPGETFTTIELAAHFFFSLKEGLITARAKVLRKGRTIAFVECDVTDETNQLIGKFSSTCLLRSGEKRENHKPTQA
ncbi:MAG: PaaI family thioesterase [Anaerolineales bacterium]